MDDTYPDGYMESDKDFVMNNFEWCIRQLTEATRVKDSTEPDEARILRQKACLAYKEAPRGISAEEAAAAVIRPHLAAAVSEPVDGDDPWELVGFYRERVRYLEEAKAAFDAEYLPKYQQALTASQADRARIEALTAENAKLRAGLEEIGGNNWRDQSRARHVARATLTKEPTDG